MPECIPQLRLSFHRSQPVEVSFDAPRSSSDGGAVLLRCLDEREGWSERLAECLTERRRAGRIRHSLHEQVRQRLFQIALGYEDCNDADPLRRDPVLLTVCDRSPDDTEGLSSQPTLSRFENGVGGRGLRRLIRRFEHDYVASLAEDTEQVVLDIDATHDPTHGQQELAFFHGFYDKRIYHPQVVFDGESGQLITALLRPGRTHASRWARAVLRRLIRRIKERLPGVRIPVRGDSHFAMPAILEELERLDAEPGGVDYVLGLAKRHPRAVRSASPRGGPMRVRAHRSECPVLHRDALRREELGRLAPHRRAGRAHRYWKPNPRFVVTSLEDEADAVYHLYCQRGDCENRIKDFKNALAADRLSCSRSRANFFRLLLHPEAYQLLWALRQSARRVSDRLGRAQFDTLRLRLLKVAALVRRSRRRIWIQLPEVFPEAEAFRRIASGLDPPAAPA